MSDLVVNEHVKLTGLPEGWANSAETQRVVLWDMGPKKPAPPKRPEAPKGKEGDPEYDLALIEFKDALGDYEAALKAFKQAKIDYETFQQKFGGPVELTMWSCDASDALQRDKERYRISYKTRGYSKLKNKGLPPGIEPGHGQAAQEERERQGYAEYERAMRADPVFGQQEVRP